MAFYNSATVVNNVEQTLSPIEKQNSQTVVQQELFPPNLEYRLSQGELLFLLDLVKRASFVGEQVELVYTTVYKLQNQYLEQNKK